MKKISIIVPVYNREKYIKKCIVSLMEQSYKNIEIVIVDDGSKDNTLNVINELSKIDERIVVVSKSNGGVSSARNVGIEHASGEYISFVDSDDTLPFNAIETLCKYISENIDLIAGSYLNQRIINEKLIHPYTVISHSDKYTKFAEYDHFNWGPCGKLYKTSILVESNIRFDENVCFGEDHIFNINYTKYMTKDMVVISDIVYIYNNHLRDNLCSRVYDNMGQMQLALFESVIDFYENEKIEKEVYNRFLMGTITGAVSHYVINFNEKEAIEKISNVYKIFSKYVTDEFLFEKYDGNVAKGIIDGNYKVVYDYYSNRSDISKQRLKQKLKRILMKVMY